MSTQYPGGFITKSPVAPTTTAASGIWTVDQALQYVKAGTWPSPPLFIEEMFSTYLYTGNSSTQTITNNINLSGSGGLVWCKDRVTVDNHFLSDTALGTGKDLASNTDFSATTQTGITAFNTTGFTLGNIANANTSGRNYVSWTFREQPKFFDIVTYTGNGATQTINHNLGTTPGVIFCKSITSNRYWVVYHRSLGAGNFLKLNLTDAASANTDPWNNTAPTATSFSVGNYLYNNENGATFVAYLFAHDAGGFPANGGGSTNGITCGSYTGNGSTSNQINLGYEPQWLLIKRSSDVSDWNMFDNMRGVYTSLDDYILRANTTAADVVAPRLDFNANGFSPTSSSADYNASGSTYIYIAVRRGPMKTPTVGTSVLGINARTGTGAFATVTGGQTDDLAVIKARSTGAGALWTARFTGKNYLQSDLTAAESTAGTTILQTNPWDVMDGIKVGSTSSITNASGATYINYLFRRAPGFFDVVCYEGINPSITHNLGVTPEMYIVKVRSASGVTARWYVYHTGYNTASNYIALNSSAAIAAATIWGSGPTAAVIGATGGTGVNDVGQTYIAYLFATLAGISKVGSYTGTGALQTINCGFTTGARFVLIKRTDSTGDWYTYDTARGMSSGTDPYFLMNSSAAEDTTTNYVDTDTTGFKVTAAAPAELNAVGGNYIFLAIA